MFKQNLIVILIAMTGMIFLNSQSLAQDQKVKSSVHEDQMDLFVHPFFSHMALADPVGEVSFRFTGMQRRDESGSSTDFGLHIEAGILPRLGIHVRSDAFNHEPFTEVMLMYNIFTTKHENFGVSIFSQVSIPTGDIETNTYKGLFGAGIKETLPPVVVFNGDIHYDPKDDMAEYEGSFVFRASDLLYPIVEARGEITKTGTSLYILPALKFRIHGNQTIGTGFQIAVSDEREYDAEALLQYGIEF
jgi:hypothetical protein